MGTKVKAKKLREDEKILQAIDKCISSRDDQHETNKAILEEILEDVFTTMKGRDAFFRTLYQGFFFVPKYYKSLKVDKTEEFDVNIIIKIPLDYESITFSEGESGYQQLGLLDNEAAYTSQWQKFRSFLSTWLIKESSGLRINKDVFRRSIESLLARAMLNVPKIDNYTVKVPKNDPPFTLCVNKQGFPEMNVKLMPVLEFFDSPPYPMSGKFKWYALPEILQNVKDEHLQWRLAFYHHEDDLLKRHSYIKPVIRQIEKLRDTHEWNVIPRYHIKTLFMHYAINTQDDSGLPDSSKLIGVKLFIHILGELRNVCKSRDLKNCWVPGHNLVDAESQSGDIVEPLTVIIREITDDPAKLADWLLTSEELGMYQNELKAIEKVQDTKDHCQKSTTDYPKQRTTDYPKQTTSDYPKQTITAFPQQTITAFPQQTITAFPQQTITLGHRINGYGLNY